MVSPISSNSLKPGDRSELINETASALRVTVKLSDGTEVAVSLHPGAQLDLTAGHSPISVQLDHVEGPQHLRSIESGANVPRVRRRVRPASPIDRDPELAAFLRMGADTMTLEQLHLASSERFGWAPSRSAIHRFLNRVSRGFPRVVPAPEE